MTSSALFRRLLVNGIVNVRTGTPFSIFDCTNGFFFCNPLIQDGPLTFGFDQNALTATSRTSSSC